MAGTLAGKVAIITGAAQGIGKAYAEELAHRGASVVLADIKEQQILENAKAIEQSGGQATAVVADVSSEESIQALCEQAARRYDGIDIMINNAALYGDGTIYPLDEVPLDYWNTSLDVNTTSVLVSTQAVVPYMKERGSGRIIMMSSDGTAFPDNQHDLTKLLVQGFTVGLAMELGPFDITVNAIAPGITDTESTEHLFGDRAAELAQTVNAIKRLGKSSDHAELLAFLVSDEAGWITGQTFRVNGGSFRRPA